MREYPVHIKVEFTTQNNTEPLVETYVVKVEADKRQEARDKAEIELRDYLSEVLVEGTIYHFLKTSLYDDPYIKNLKDIKRKTIHSLGKLPNVMGIPSD